MIELWIFLFCYKTFFKSFIFISIFFLLYILVSASFIRKMLTPFKVNINNAALKTVVVWMKIALENLLLKKWLFSFHFLKFSVFSLETKYGYFCCRLLSLNFAIVIIIKIQVFQLEMASSFFILCHPSRFYVIYIRFGRFVFN